MNIGFDCERRVFPRLPTWLLAWTSVFAGVSATGAAAEPPPAVQLPQESAGPQPAALTAAQRAEKLGEEIWIVGTDGAKPHKLCDGGFPTWSSDGKRVFFHSRQQKQILVVDSSDLQQLLSPVEAEAKIDRPVAAGAAAKVITSPEQAASADRAGSLNNLANRYARKGDFARAEPLFREAAEIFRRSLGENHPRYALALNNLGNLYKKRGDYAQAESQFRKAIAVWEKLPGEYYPCHPVCLNNLGSLCEEKGDDAQAELLFRRALAIQEKGHGEDQPSYATSLDNLGCLYKGQGDYARAEPLLRQALAVRERAVGKNDTDYACSLNNLADLLTSQGDYAGAEPLLRQALEIRAKAGEENRADYAATLTNLAALYADKRDFARAEPLYHQALEIYGRSPGESRGGFPKTLSRLGLLYYRSGDYARALALCRRAADIQKKTLSENPADYAGSLHNLGLVYSIRGDFAAAEAALCECVAIKKKTLGGSHPNYATAVGDLALLYDEHGDYARAEPLYEEARDIFKRTVGDRHPDYARCLENLGALHADRGDRTEAESLFREALDIRRSAVGEDHPDYASSLGNLAALYETQADYTRAEPLCRQAATIIRSHIEATSVIQSERQQLAMLRRLRHCLDDYLSLAVRSGRYAEPAYRELLAWKGTVLRRSRLVRAASQSQELAPVFNRLQQVVTRWAFLARATPDPKQAMNWRRQLGRLLDEKERLEAELSARSAAYRRAKKDIAPLEIQEALPAEAALADFLVCRVFVPGTREGSTGRRKMHLVAAVVRKDLPVRLVDLGDVAPLQEATETWRGTFGLSPKGLAAGSLLRKRIWEPLEPLLKDARTVLVSPDDFLGRLPLGALPGKTPGSYLIEERAMAVVPAPQMIPALVNEPGQEKLKKRLLLLGDVDYDADPGVQRREPAPAAVGPFLAASRGVGADLFQALPGTRDEIDAIERICRHDFPAGDDVTKLVRAAATKRAFWEAASQHASIHVATHGFFAPSEVQSALATPTGLQNSPRKSGEAAELQGYSPGLLSGLVLTGANRAVRQDERGSPAAEAADNGILTAEEINSMNLEGVTLVTLSACETGLGKVAGGEGLLGLQRGFQVAGARAVVASLWKVDDQGTQTLMVEFYKNLWEKKLPKLEALRQAQLTMLRGYDPKAGKLRGSGAVRPVDPKKLAAAKDAGSLAREGLSPFYWAAFVLSGDWR